MIPVTADQPFARLRRAGRVAGLAAFCALGLAACGSATLTSYDLDAATPPAGRTGGIKGALVIADPDADSAIDSDRIVVRTGENALAYLSDAQWSERLPGLVQSRLIGSFQNARLVKSVGRPGSPSDYSLQLEIRRFEIDVTANIARIEMSARILSTKTNKPVAARIFAGSAPAPTTANGAAAAALDKALSDVMRAIVKWTAAAI